MPVTDTKDMARITIELPDGKVFELLAHSFTLDSRFGEPITTIGGMNFYVPTEREISLSAKATEMNFFMHRKDFIREIENRRGIVEWKCDYCGSVHPREKTNCSCCGASRSFVYG